jgi:hypothetical protein
MSACVRQAWLALPNGATMALDNPAGGWSCQSLDLGSPVVRSVMANKPDADGIIDRTQYMGPRTVVAAVTAMAPLARIDDVADNFAPFMVPSVRPVLHFILDRPGAPERTLILRGDSYDWPIVGAAQRDIAMQWIAADPVARDVAAQVATAWAGNPNNGRPYNLTFDRTYPVGSTSPVNGVIRTPGDVPVKPMLRIYGPITGASVQMTTGLQPTQYFRVNFLSSYRIDAGNRVDVDTAAHTAVLNGDPTQSVLNQLDWSSTVWPLCPVNPDSTGLVLGGASTSGITQVQATWHDGYLT